MADVVLAVDAGTTGVRTVAIDADGARRAFAYREFPQHFPRPGWVEHDPDDIWQAVQDTLGEVVAALERDTVAAIGITDQRETVVVWDRRTGRPRHRAVVWQDRRTAARCDDLRVEGLEPMVRKRTGLVLDPYFSATKLEWLLREGGVTADADLAFGTVDSWVLWNLTGEHATEPSNASRTMLYDLDVGDWSDELLDLFGVPRACLPALRASSGRFGVTDPARAAGLSVPVSGIAGDQQAALFGQACFTPGMTKNTYGTGSFVLVNLGDSHPPPVDGLLTTVAWQLGDTVTYAMEGSIFVTGAAVQWLRDGLGIIDASSEAGPLAASVDDPDGVVFVPAFTGLGSPWFDPYARGAVRTSCARSSSRWPGRPPMSSTPSPRPRGSPSPSCASTAARARWTCCASSRPMCSVSPCGVRPIRRRRCSARPTWRASPRVCGRHLQTPPPRGTRKPRSHPRRSPGLTPAAPNGTAPSTAPATGSRPTPDPRGGRRLSRAW
jgi:glycerol kinase